jgi:hypothetical protein
MPLHRSGVALLPALTGELSFDVWLSASCCCHLLNDFGRVAVCRWSTLECCGDASTHFGRDRRPLSIAGLALPMMPLVAHRVHSFEIVFRIVVGIFVDVMDVSDAVPDTFHGIAAVSARPRSRTVERLIRTPRALRVTRHWCTSLGGLALRTVPRLLLPLGNHHRTARK